jgi:hypothetical protein
MSAESSPNPPKPEFENPVVFPISEKAIGDTLAWLSYFTSLTEANLKIEEKHLGALDSNLANYFKSMGELRSQLQLTEEQLEQYRHGSIFGINLLTNQFASVGLQLPQANKSALSTYFKSLITNPWSRHNTDVRYLTLVGVQPGMMKGPITPPVLTEMFSKAPSDKLLLGVKETFDKNTDEKLRQMWNGESNLAKAVPAIKNVIGEGQRGFYLGLMDGYWPYNIDHVIGPYAELLDQLEF